MITDKTSLQINPMAIKPADIAKLLRTASGQQVSESMVQAAIDSGAPVDAKGFINLVEFIAWLEKQNQR
ncbi:MAG: hypothetical protein BWY69_00778 [Planctomycetes bacterium ADurb.Bin401]|jgi:hypothetical protein|nr:MAG: hypothetical protein BWY69_00778 [Planctomycetes bacterium ADurb.Bin401]